MEIAVVGLGKMGGQIAEKLSLNDFTVYGYDQNINISSTNNFSFETTDDLDTLVNKFNSRRIIWLMVPSGEPTNSTIEKLVKILNPGDIIIDGGNSYYKDTINNSEISNSKNINFIDCGTSGGVWGLKNGFCLTIGGEKKIYLEIKDIFSALSTSESKGGLFVGKSGSGHYVKMIHNGIEYGMMQSIAEGLEILEKKEEFNLKLDEISNNWKTGSVVQSWLIDLISDELKKNPKLVNFSSEVSDSGEGRWTIKESIDLSVPIPSI